MTAAVALNQSIVENSLTLLVSPAVDVSAGHPLPVEWAGVPGADDVEVTECRLRLDAVADERSHPGLAVTAADNTYTVTLPDGEDLRSLTLTGLTRIDGEEETVIGAQSDIEPDRRLAVALAAGTGGGFGPPAFAVPPVWGTGQIPTSLGGASLEFAPQPVLRFPAGVRARRVRISLSTGSDFTAQPMSLGPVSALTARAPRDLTITGPDGAEVFAAAGEERAGTGHEVDLTNAARLALKAALGPDGQPLAATFTVRGGPGSHVRLWFSGARGALRRTLAGRATTALAGEPVPPARVVGLPPAAPGSATGDLTITYEGLRLHPELSDPLPDAPVGGLDLTVHTGPVLRALPPAGPGPLPLARIGLYARAAGLVDAAGCELTLTLVRLGDGGALGPAAAVTVPAGAGFHLVWFDVPAAVAAAASTADTPLALAVAVTSGRCLWAARAGQPVARFAVADPDPPRSPVWLGAQVLATVGASGTHQPGAALPAAAFVADPPPLHSDLFVTVDLSDVVLRYPR